MILDSYRMNFVWWRVFCRHFFIMSIFHLAKPFCQCAQGVMNVQEHFLISFNFNILTFCAEAAHMTSSQVRCVHPLGCISRSQGVCKEKQICKGWFCLIKILNISLTDKVFKKLLYIVLEPYTLWAQNLWRMDQISAKWQNHSTAQILAWVCGFKSVIA